jgi:hypothetical protein
VRRVVLHPSAFVDWFGGSELRADFEAGQLLVVVPTSFVADTMGLLAARGWPADRIERAAGEIRLLGFQLTEPPDSELAMWLARGKPSAAATYAALASSLDTPIAVRDEELRRALRTLPQL